MSNRALDLPQRLNLSGWIATFDYFDIFCVFARIAFIFPVSQRQLACRTEIQLQSINPQIFFIVIDNKIGKSSY